MSVLAQADNDTAGGSVDRKLTISRNIWSHIFATIDFDKEGQRLPMTKPDFQRVNESFYRAYAEYLDEPELLVHERMYKTRIGSRIAENMLRTLLGLQSFTLTYEAFSEKDKEEWESFSRENYAQIKITEHKMKGFGEFIQRKFAQNKTPPVQATR